MEATRKRSEPEREPAAARALLEAHAWAFFDDYVVLTRGAEPWFIHIAVPPGGALALTAAAAEGGAYAVPGSTRWAGSLSVDTVTRRLGPITLDAQLAAVHEAVGAARVCGASPPEVRLGEPGAWEVRVTLAPAAGPDPFARLWEHLRGGLSLSAPRRWAELHEGVLQRAQADRLVGVDPAPREPALKPIVQARVARESGGRGLRFYRP